MLLLTKPTGAFDTIATVVCVHYMLIAVNSNALNMNIIECNNLFHGRNTVKETSLLFRRQRTIF
jgi:hypothetical protein